MLLGDMNAHTNLHVTTQGEGMTGIIEKVGEAQVSRVWRREEHLEDLPPMFPQERDTCFVTAIIALCRESEMQRLRNDGS